MVKELYSTLNHFLGNLMSDEFDHDEKRVFIQTTAVIDVNFLDREVLTYLLGEIEVDTDQQYLPWHTDRNETFEAKNLSALLVSKGVPRNLACLLKMY